MAPVIELYNHSGPAWDSWIEGMARVAEREAQRAAFGRPSPD